MRQVAVVTALNIAAITIATLISYELHPRDAVIERMQREHQELVAHNERIERMLAGALNRHPASAAGEPSASMSKPQSLAAANAETAARRLTREEQAAHDELVQSSHAAVDRAIASGVVEISDFAKVAAATRGLSAAERAEIMARLSAAMNTNQVRLEHSIGSP